MAVKEWLGDDVDTAQVDLVSFAEDQPIAEGNRLVFAIGTKQLIVEAPENIEDYLLGTGTGTGDTGGVLALLSAAEAAINATDILEIGEWEALLETYDPEVNGLDLFFARLRLTARTAGIPIIMNVSSDKPTVDVDVVQVGGPGRNEIQSFFFTPTPDGETFTISQDFGLGVETSASISVPFTADSVKAAMVAGMTTPTSGDLEVTGVGTSSDPVEIEYIEGLAETNFAELTVNVTNLTGGAGAVFVSQTQQGGQTVESTGTGTGTGAGELAFQDLFTDTNGTFISSHVATSGQSYTHLQGTEPEIQSNALTVGATANLSLSKITPPLAANFLAEITAALGSTAVEQWAGFFFRYTNADNYWLALLWKGTTSLDIPRLVIIRVQSGSLSIMAQGATPHVLGTPYTLTLTAVGGAITLSSPLDSISISDSHNSTAQEMGVGFIFIGGGVPPTLDTYSIYGYQATNERQSISHNGTGGSITLTRPGAGTTAAIPVSSSVGTVAAALATAGVYGVGNVLPIGGTGIPGDPWIVEFINELAGTDLPLMTGNAGGLTGLVVATVTTEQDGSPPTGMKWHVYLVNATSGIYQFQLLGREANVNWNANAASVLAALEAMTPGNFAGQFTVTGGGTAVDNPFIISAVNDLVGIEIDLVIDTSLLFGLGQTLVHTTETPANGRFWIDNEANWRDTATGLKGLPTTGDEIQLYRGDLNNSMKYGSLAGRKLRRMVQNMEWTGEFGLPLDNPAGYKEYRDRFIELEFEAQTQSEENPNVIIGDGIGSGSGLFRLRTGGDEVHIRVNRTGGTTEGTLPAFCWDSQYPGTGTGEAQSTLQLIEGFAGVAVFPGTEATLHKVVQRGGVLRVGEGLDIGAGGLDRSAGQILGQCSINGVPVKFGEA